LKRSRPNIVKFSDSWDESHPDQSNVPNIGYWRSKIYNIIATTVQVYLNNGANPAESNLQDYIACRENALHGNGTELIELWLRKWPSPSAFVNHFYNLNTTGDEVSSSVIMPVILNHIKFHDYIEKKAGYNAVKEFIASGYCVL